MALRKKILFGWSMDAMNIAIVLTKLASQKFRPRLFMKKISNFFRFESLNFCELKKKISIESFN